MEKIAFTTLHLMERGVMCLNKTLEVGLRPQEALFEPDFQEGQTSHLQAQFS